MRQNSDLILVGANVAMVAIWLIYLQLFWMSYRRQLRASVIIHLGAGTGLDAQCLISNMSAEAIHIEGIILVLRRGTKSWRTAITTAGEAERGTGSVDGPRPIGLHEGPLASGGFVNIGRFQDLVDRAFGKVEDDDEAPETPDVDSFEIWVIADYSAEQKLVFARRVFKVGQRDGRWALRAEQMRTETLRGGKRQRQIKQELQDHLEKSLMPKGDDT